MSRYLTNYCWSLTRCLALILKHLQYCHESYRKGKGEVKKHPLWCHWLEKELPRNEKEVCALRRKTPTYLRFYLVATGYKASTLWLDNCYTKRTKNILKDTLSENQRRTMSSVNHTSHTILAVDRCVWLWYKQFRISMRSCIALFLSTIYISFWIRSPVIHSKHRCSLTRVSSLTLKFHLGSKVLSTTVPEQIVVLTGYS